VGRSLAFVAALVTLAVLPVTVGCAGEPTRRIAPASSGGETTAAPVADPAREYLRSRARVFIASDTVEFDLKTQRLAPSASGESSVWVGVGVFTGGTPVKVAYPDIEIRALTPTRTVVMPHMGAVGGDWSFNGYSGSGTFTVPPDTHEIVLVAHVGASVEAARNGVEIRARLEDIPVVDHLYTWGTSGGF